MPKFVITGASGGGKSTLIAALAGAGFATVPEAGRQIVAEQMASGGTALPWRDQAAFMDLLFVRSIAAFDGAEAAPGRPVFFDRSFIEAIAYGAVIGRPPPRSMQEAAGKRRFDGPVFVCPPWEEIFARDGERRHDFDFALRDHEANVAAYRASGYELMEIPRVSVEERVAFVIARTGAVGEAAAFQSGKKTLRQPGNPERPTGKTIS
ncbi:AAA family ATPase [Hoeflea sp. BAL378]|uniref:AAA family ATPase n=1 Tax=Hoeflea sp. BAL378 TaxID=1547437 RepID=UPI0009DE8870|nr:AAA family ATPase [Hoeflea sp. BAL378]